MPADERLLGQLMAKADMMEKAMCDMKRQQEDGFRDVNKKIDDLMGVKDRGVGIVTTLMFVSGIVGALFSELLKWAKG